MTNNLNPAENRERVTETADVGTSQMQGNSEHARLDTARRRLSIVLLALTVIATAYLIFRRINTGAWQHLVAALISIPALVATIYAYRMARRGRSDMAAYIMLFAASLDLAVFGLFFSEADWVFAIGSLVFLNVIGTMLLPRRMWWHTLVMSIVVSGVPLFAGGIGLPWERYKLLTGESQSSFFYIVIVAAAIALVGELFFSYRRIVRLGVRLAVIFGLVIMAAITITILASILVVGNATRDQAFDELETTTQLKRNSIQSWVGTLNSELGTVLVEGYELDRARVVLLEESNVEFQVTAARELRILFNNVIERNFNFTEISIVNMDGQVMLSSDVSGDDKWVDHQPWFLLGQNQIYVDQPRYSLSDGGLVMVFSQPLYDQVGTKIGVIAGKANLSKLSSLVGASPAGATGKTYLIAGNHEVVGEQRYVYSEGIEAVLRGESSLATYDDYEGERVLGHYLRLPEIGTGFINEINEDEVLATGRRSVAIVNSAVSIGVEIVAVIAAVLVARSISTPLNRLVETANRVSAGELDLRAEVTSEDEIGELGHAFNAMTDQLQRFIADLEQRVQERTDGLAAVGEVTRATTSQLDIAQLLPSVVNTVRDRFNLYYVGLFLTEERRDGSQVAMLRAATGEAGEQMISQNWQLDVGPGSMIGNSIFTGQPRVRQSSTELGPWQRNPYLPETESELALPLRFGDRVLGSMTVQSTEDNAFDDTTIDLLQNMADQVAVAIENARLFAESRQALDRAQIIQQRYQSQAWRNYLLAQSAQGVAYSETAGTQMADRQAVPALPDDVVIEQDRLLIPIMQGTQQVGVVGFEGKEGGWQPEEIALLRALTEQLSQAAENQRLLNETQQRAAREQTIGRVADSLRQSLDVETVLSTAAGEIREALGLDRIVVRLAEPEQRS